MRSRWYDGDPTAPPPSPEERRAYEWSERIYLWGFLVLVALVFALPWVVGVWALWLRATNLL